MMNDPPHDHISSNTRVARTPYTLSMPGGDPLATCTLPVGDVYLLTYLRPQSFVSRDSESDPL